MSNWIPVVITKKGLALQAKVEAGTVLKFTKMALGSGKPNDLATATALASLKQNLAIASKDVNNNTCVVYATGTNIGVTTAYQASELGLYAQDPDEGEILYAVTTDDTPDTVPSNSSATVITQRIGLAVAVSASSTVSVVLSTKGFVTAADAENIANDVMTAHKTKTPLDHPAKSVQEKHLADGAVSTRALSNTGVAAGTYKSVTVDVKGRVSAGTNPTTLAGYGITDAYPKSTSDARYLPVRGKAVDAEKADVLTPVNLGNFSQKTIGELKTALRNWVKSENEVFAVCYFSGVAVASLRDWNQENTIISDGILWTAMIIGGSSNQNYKKISITSYNAPNFECTLSGGDFGGLIEIANKSDLITSINGVSTPGGAVDLSGVFYKNDGSVPASVLVTTGVVKKITNDGYLEVCSGNGYSGGAFLSLFGKDATVSPYQFYIDSNGKKLIGKPTGELRWDNKNIVRSVNGATADLAGNVNLNYYPATGGALSGNITRPNNTYLLDICGGSGGYNTNTGGGILVYGSNVPGNSLSGGFIVYTSTMKRLIGWPGGTLEWDGKNLATTDLSTTSAAGLLPKLSGNANDVMTGTGAWWNRTWRQAYSGAFTTVGGVVCTLPANWVEVYLTASTFGSSGLENSGIYSKSDQGKELEYGRGQCELQFKINSNNQVVLNSIGAGGDGVVRGVYYR